MTRSIGIGAAVCLLLLCGSVRADTITFSKDGEGNWLARGQIIDDEFTSIGVTVSADNPNRSFDYAIIFDSKHPTGGDTDLKTPGSLGNAKDERLGKILILSERGYLNCKGHVAIPDDEGRNPAGTITFTWDTPITELGFHLVDIEDNAAERAGYFMALKSGGTVIATLDFGDLEARDSSIDFGNNSVNWIDPIAAWEFGASSFDQVVIGFGGSAGIDNLTWKSVPEPAAWTLLLVAAGALLARRRPKTA